MKSVRCILPLLGGSCLFLAAATAATFKSLYSFGDAPDGRLPLGAMAVDRSGVLFGATESGGAYGRGAVFSLRPPASPAGPWSEEVLWSFGGSPSDGAGPMGGVVIGSGGVLYGTTYEGGTMDGGTVFALTPPGSPGGAWTESIVFSFGGAGTGGSLESALVIGTGGVLYGTTPTDYAVFSLTPPPSPGGAWTEKTIGYLGGTSTGCGAVAPVAIASDGTLYSTTNWGLACDGVGTVFSLAPLPGGDWNESLLYAFPSSDVDGAFPTGVVVGAGGVLYGATVNGGAGGDGTVFSLSPPATTGDPWTEAVLYGFSGADGNGPFTNLWLSKQTGALYGTTSAGGYLGPKPRELGLGTVFELRPPASPGNAWTLRELHHFLGNDGADPQGSLTERNGVFYGTTFQGGTNDNGTVYSVVP